MSEKNKALRLAAELEWQTHWKDHAAELRRLAKVEDEWMALSQDQGKLEGQIDRLVAQRDALLEALRNVTVHLIAAHSLLHRGGKKAAASDAMFSMMLADYEKSFEVGRAAIKAVEGEKT
jgi:hypothetical protein